MVFVGNATLIKRLVALFSIGLAGLAIGACSSTKEAASEAGARAQNAVSPIVGTWRINGDTPAPQPNLPQFVVLTFEIDGRLEASYVAAGGALAGVIGKTSKLKQEHDTYTLQHDKTLSIVEGSRALDFGYDVRDGKLFLTSKNGGDTVVYHNVAG